MLKHSSSQGLADTPHRVWIRTAAGRDLESLTEYFEKLSEASRYNRFMGGVGNFSRVAFDCLLYGRRAERFTLVAELRERSCDAIIGEASYAFDSESRCGEFAISVSDDWQRRGLGSALLSAVQFRAVNLGFFNLFGETLKTNHQTKAFARKAGFEFTRSPDWRAVRLDKKLIG
jgi:RimJ/RimL family protein N-acetyltransferase